MIKQAIVLTTILLTSNAFAYCEWDDHDCKARESQRQEQERYQATLNLERIERERQQEADRRFEQQQRDQRIYQQQEQETAADVICRLLDSDC